MIYFPPQPQLDQLSSFRDYPWIDSISPITVNQTKELLVTGLNFTPESVVSIAGVTINNQIVVNNKSIKLSVTSGNQPGEHLIIVSNGSLSSDAWDEKKYLVITPSLSTGWIDYRNITTATVQSTANNSETSNLGVAGLQSNSSGLTSTSTQSNLLVNFSNITLPSSASYTFESICFFFSGTHGIWTGISNKSANWINPRRSCLILNAIENRSYSRCYYGKDWYYQSIDNVTGVNWNNSFIHTVIEVEKNKIITNSYSRTTVSYDWDKGTEGEKVFSQHHILDESIAVHCPSIYFFSANSASYLVAQRIIDIAL